MTFYEAIIKVGDSVGICSGRHELIEIMRYLENPQLEVKHTENCPSCPSEGTSTLLHSMTLTREIYSHPTSRMNFTWNPSIYVNSSDPDWIIGTEIYLSEV